MAEQPIRLAVGGDVQAKNGTYLQRPADDELFEACLAGEFAYVLACRQIGKSSLKNAVAERLIAEGVRVARVDLNRIGKNVEKAEIWYFSLLDQLACSMGLETDVEKWWESQPQRLTLTQRFLRFFDEVVLTEITEPVVIFIDEIDVTLGLPFTDDFFAAIRTVYNDRAQYPAYQRLTFVLLGWATPDELIQDDRRTPFNIGRAIPMRDFTLAECEPLRHAIEAKHPGVSELYFEHIYDWTKGHPYLTQKLCAAVANTPRTDDPDLDFVGKLVNRIFLTEEERSEENIRFVETRVLGDSHKLDVLGIYKQVLRSKVVPDNEKSLAINRLKLYGLIIVQNGHLKIRNEIYRRVFDLAWVRANTAVNWTRIVAVLTSFVALLAIGAILYNAWVGIQVQNCIANFYQTNVPEERATHLVKLFRLQGLLGPTDYDYKARELFYGLSRDEQLALFADNDVDDSDLTLLVRNLYTTLADVDGTDSTGPLLEAMVEALDYRDKTEGTKGLREEIISWLDGREYTKQNHHSNALAAYDKAIKLNGDNPATLYERARVLIALSEYQQALSDLDRVVVIARQVSAPTPTVIAITSPTVTPTATPTPVPPEPTPSRTLAPSGAATESTESPTISGAPTSTLVSLPTAKPSPTVTPAPASIASEFVTTGQMISAVRNLIYGVPSLVTLLANTSTSEYPNLRESGLVPTSTPIPTLVAVTTTPSATQEGELLSLTPTITPTSEPGEPPKPTGTPTVTPTPLVIFVTDTPPNLPTPTATVTSSPAPTLYAALQLVSLVSPGHGASLRGASPPPRLEWTSTALLGPNDYYLVRLKLLRNGNPYPYRAWLKGTSWEVPTEVFYLADPPERQIQWQVVVAQIPPGGDIEDVVELSPISETRTFTWEPIPLPDGEGIGVVVNPKNSQQVLVALTGIGIYKSDNGGIDWRQVSNERTVETLHIASANAEVIYAGAFAQVLKSEDQGEDWSPLSIPPDAQVYAIATDPDDANIVFVATDRGIMRSSDGGLTWLALDREGPSGAQVLDSRFYSIVAARTPQGNRIYAAGEGDQIHWRGTHDTGSPWQTLVCTVCGRTIFALAVDPRNSNKLLAGSDEGVLGISLNAGYDWQPATIPTLIATLKFSVLAIDPADPQIVYAGSGTHRNPSDGEGLYRSEDGGQTWHRFNNWTPSGEGTGTYVQGIALTPADGQLIFIAGSEGVFRSDDRGNNWTRQ